MERYIFTNYGKEPVSLYDMGIYTPLNDNYPGAQECINGRTNVQVWDGENAAYVNALRMGGTAPHLGMVVTEGAVKSYEVWERGDRKGNSHYRGILALNLPDCYLKPGKSYAVAWTIFRIMEMKTLSGSCLKRVVCWWHATNMCIKGERRLECMYRVVPRWKTMQRG